MTAGGLRGGVRRLAHAAGVFGLMRRLTRRHLRILMYHSVAASAEDNTDAVTIDALRSHLRHLQRHYCPMPLSELTEAISAGSVPERAVALTFDDGHATFLSLAAPLFAEMRIPATVFVVTDLLEPGSWLWPDKLGYIAGARPQLSRLPHDRMRLRPLAAMEPRERDKRVRELAEEAGVNIPVLPPPRYQLLSWEELKELAANPFVEIGSHTRSHPILSAVSDDAAWEEIAGSKRMLEERLGIEVRSFAYPFGLSGDYLPRDAAFARQVGYRCAVSAESANANPSRDPYRLPRIGIDGVDETFFAKYIDGFDLLQHRFLSCSR